MYAQLDLTDLLQLESEETLVLTVNNRFARRILSELQRSLSGEHKAIAVPDIMPLSAWLRQANDDLSFHDGEGPASYLLDTFSSLHVWEQIIYAQEAENAWLIDVPQAAKLAADADLLMDEWSLHINESEHTADSLRFLEWRDAYKVYLQSHDLDDQNRAAQRVVDALEQQVYQPHWKNIVLVGFHDTSKRLQRLILSLVQQDKKIYVLREAERIAADCKRVLAPTPEAEWRLAAQWAARQLKANPSGTYAIVAFDLQNQVPFAHRVLAHELAPHADDEVGFNWNIAVGRPLSQWPLVRSALAWLQALAEYQQGAVRCKTLGHALLGGYCVADQTESHLRARLDVKWRMQQQVVLQAEQVDTALTECPELSMAWERARDVFGGQPKELSPAQWVPLMRTALQALGFPGEHSLDSHAYQTMQVFEQRLSLFARLAPVFGIMSLAQGVHMLQRYLYETIFQPQREAGTRLDVLGLLEAEGGRWDGVWVLGVTDEVLPAIPKPNPFIPYQVLKQAEAPRSTPERELQWAHYMMGVLKQAAPVLTFSHAEQDNGQLLRPSPFIQAIELQVAIDPLLEVVSAVAPLEQLLDEQGPPVAVGEPIFGGSALLDRQARNPLWAFVQHRLHAKALLPYEDSSTIRLWRGNFLHQALELFWLGLEERSSKALAQVVATGNLEQKLDQALHAAAGAHLQKLPLVIQRLEQERAKQVLLAWLNLEQSRAAFTVQAIEQSHRLSGLNTKMRIDRIDRLQEGQHVLIDYKTSKAHKRYSAWLRDRPIELQLPIYAAILTEQGQQVAALAFAFLHYEPALGGFGLERAGLTQTDAKKFDEHFGSWDAFIEHLQQQIYRLRDEFLQGVARNEFYAQDDLMYCEVLPFLRLNQELMGAKDEA